LIGSQNDKTALAAASDEGDIYDNKTLVRLSKARHMAGKDTALYFEGAQHRFRELQTGDL